MEPPVTVPPLESGTAELVAIALKSYVDPIHGMLKQRCVPNSRIPESQSRRYFRSRQQGEVKMGRIAKRSPQLSLRVILRKFCDLHRTSPEASVGDRELGYADTVST